MAGFLKFLLISYLLVMLGFCGWWHIMTPQPVGIAAQAGYMWDTLRFQTGNMTRLPRFNAPDSVPDQAEMDEWRDSARKGNHVAQIYLAQGYFAKGAKDPAGKDSTAYALAIQYLTPASNEGIPIAQNALGVAYRYGLGVKQDPVMAYQLFAAASARGLKLAKQNMFDMARLLTPEQMAVAQSNARVTTKP